MIFVEVGAHHGQSIEVAMNPRFAFTRLIAIEPSSNAIREIRKLKDARIEIIKVALSNTNNEAYLYGSGNVGASLLREKSLRDESENWKFEKVQVKRASEVLGPILKSQCEVFIRMNCEGSEIAILSDLIAAGLINSKHHIAVDFDVSRIFKSEKIKDEFLVETKQLGLDIFEPPPYSSKFLSDNKKFVKEWLMTSAPRTKAKPREFLTYSLRLYLPPLKRFKRAVSWALPKRLKIFLYPIITESRLTRLFWLNRLINAKKGAIN